MYLNEIEAHVNVDLFEALGASRGHRQAPLLSAEIEVGARLELCLALQIDEVAVSQLGDHGQRARLAQRLLPGHPPCRNRLRQPVDRCPLNAVPAAQQLTDVLDHYWRAPLFIDR